MNLTSLFSCIQSIQPYDFLAWSAILSGIIIFWKWHVSKDNTFNLMDLVCENGKLSSAKSMRIGTWAVMSYGFYLLAKTSPESLVAYAPLYGGIWVSARALDKWQQNNAVNVNASKSETYTDSNQTLTNISLTGEQVESLKHNYYHED